VPVVFPKAEIGSVALEKICAPLHGNRYAVLFSACPTTAE
jgi:hypothetical protein